MISTLVTLCRHIRVASLKLLTAGALIVLTGCSANPIYTTTGVVLSNFAESETTPYVLETSDPRLACALGESLDSLIYSFSRVMDAPDDTGSLLMLLAGNCSQYKAWEAELAYVRADYQGNIEAAKDAREEAKRMNALTARRRYASFRRAMAAYEFDPSAEPVECPFLFSDQDELIFLLGLMTGMQAIVNDANSGGMGGVPKNIAPQTERVAACLDNEKWAGMPNAIRSLVWLLLPDTRPEGVSDPWQVLEGSTELGVEKGLRIPHAIQTIAAETFGRRDKLEEAIASFAESSATIEVWDDYRLLDEIATDMVHFSSDKYWSANYGYRTPQSFFGKMSPEGESENVETMSLDGLL